MTAVEYLIEQLFELRNPTLNQIEILKKAKEKEKQHIQNAFYRGIQEGIERTISESLFFKTTPEQYYNEQFKNKIK